MTKSKIEKPKTEEPKVESKTRELPNIPKKIGSLTLKKTKTDYDIVDSDGETIGCMTIPRQCGTYYNPNWAVFRENSLLECFAALTPTLVFIQKTFDIKKKKKKD